MGAYDETVGFLLIGVIINTYLYGLVSFQFITYYTSGFQDPLWIRAIVFIMLVNDTFHSLSLVYMAWVYCVTNFTNSEAFQYTIWPYPFTAIATVIAGIMTHLLLGYRIYRFTQLKSLFVFICIITVAIFIMGLTFGIRVWMIHVIDKLFILDALAICWFSFRAGLDVFIATIMVISLNRSRSPYRQTNTVIYRLMRGAIQTGIFCSIFAVGDLIALLEIPKSNLHLVFAFSMGRIYTGTLMDTLNMREALKDVLNEPRTVVVTNGMELSCLDCVPSSMVAAADVEQIRANFVVGKQKGITPLSSADLSPLKSRLDGEPEVSV